MRYLCIDLGDRRTGLAVGAVEGTMKVASPLAVLEVPIADDGGVALVRAIVRHAIEHLGSPPAPGEIVMGLPLNMDGSEGPRAALARAFATRVERATGRRVWFGDERLTSAEADWKMSQSGLTRGQKKARRDAIAAAEILRAFLESGPVGGRGNVS